MPGPANLTTVYCLRRRAAFTLVEMLVVMGIVVLLLAATLPALRGLSQSESRRGAVGNVMGVLDHARMMAISDGLATYVVFACKTPNDPQINAECWGRSYAIYQDNDNVSFLPVQKTPWMTLPKGMSFKVNADIASSILTCYTVQSAQATDPAFPMSKAVGTGSAKLPYWKFDNIGNVTVPASVQSPQRSEDYLKLLLFPGYIDANGNEVATQNVSTTSSDQQKMQLEEIDVNPATGRAKYIIDPNNNLSTPSSTTSPSP